MANYSVVSLFGGIELGFPELIFFKIHFFQSFSMPHLEWGEKSLITTRRLLIS